jgi:hypothetical protein
MPKLKNVLLAIIFGPIGVVIGLIVLIGVSPFIVFFGLSNLYLKLFRHIRHDPKVELPRLVTKKQVEHTQSLEEVLKYLELLTESMASHGGGVASELKKSTRNGEPDDADFKAVTVVKFERSIESEHAKIVVELDLIELERHDGEIFHVAQRNDEDSQLGDYIEAEATLKGASTPESFHINLDFGYEGVYFCIGLLSGDGWYNDKTGQLWSHLSKQKVWMVRYNDKGDDFGFRKTKGKGVAREKWFDSDA